MAAKPDGGRALSAATLRCCESALRKLDGLLQGAPATDASVADRLHAMRRSGASRSSAAAVVSALSWRARRQGAPSPCASLCRAALAAFPKPGGSGAKELSPSTQRDYDLALRRLDRSLRGAEPDDALLAGRVRSFAERGLSRSAARAVVTAAAWDARRRGRPSPKGPLTAAALAELPVRSGRIPVRPEDLSKVSRAMYEWALRGLDASLKGAPLTDRTLAAHLRGLLEARDPLARAVAAVSAATWRMALQGRPSPRGPETAKVMKSFRLANVEGRLRNRRGHDRPGVAPATRANYESALRRMGAEGVPMTDAGLARFIHELRERGRSAGSGQHAASAAAWDAERRGQANPVGPLTKAALREFKQSDASRPRRKGAIAASTQAGYEAALRRMRAEMGADPDTDELLAAHVGDVLQRGVSVLAAAFRVSAAVWRAKRNGLDSPNGPLTKAALRTGAKG